MTDDAATPGTPGMVFYVGAHQPQWLWRAQFPLFISHRQLARRSRPGLRPAVCRWGLDSGGFTALTLDGCYRMTAPQYAESAADLAARLGNMDFAAPMDWMCEPFMIERTGLSVAEHQQRTVANYLELRTLAPGLAFIPVIQGWQLADYLACVDLYASAGVDLTVLPRVGLGSVCRRQSTTEIAVIVAALARLGLRLHGFGVKTAGLRLYGHLLTSADSMAWSYAARRRPALPGCRGHANCANCLTYATRWRTQTLAGYAAHVPYPALFEPQECLV